MTLTSGDTSPEVFLIKSESPFSPVSPVVKSSSKHATHNVNQTLRNPKQKLPVLQSSSVDDQYNDPKADLILVSSDGIGFKVQSIYVRAASKILNDKCLALVSSLSPIPTIDFEDRSIERATTIRFLLDFSMAIYPSPNTNFWALAKRYSENGEIPLIVFVLGASLGDIQLCCDAIMDGDESHEKGMDDPPEWYDHTGDDVVDKDNLNEGDDGVEDDDNLSSTMDPTTWKTQDIQHIPARYLAGLLRASRVRDQPGKDWYDVAHKFEDLMSPNQKVDQSIKQEEMVGKDKGVVAKDEIKDIKVKSVVDGDTKKKRDTKGSRPRL
ncbi:hypothetical protein V865_006858 [Kwoniella europaea PYCC6329]|uniref:Proteasome assembly chaperone 2 n=1 Tax=Kwoniella europaea PYCC6329 TaxID=1423913 RepID=A0AAX4KT61_9TREE